MKLFRWSAILLALLLASMAIVPMVSAGENTAAPNSGTVIENNYVSAGVANQQANAAVKDFVGRNALDVSWTGATVKAKPDVILDVNGKRLFYLFPVEKNGKRIGEIKIAASKVLGASVVTIGSGAPPVDIAKITSKATEIINQQSKNGKITSVDLVCYDYPAIGALVTFTVPGSGINSMIIDAYDYSVIPSSRQVSFYDAIPISDMTTRVGQWDSEQTQLQASSTQSLSPMATVTKTISGFTLYPQEGANWCAFATAKMVSAYYGYSRTQSGIAATMGVNPNDGASIETTRSNYYLVSVANGGLGKTGSALSYTGMFTYNNIVSEMNVNRPIHTDRYETSSYHARAITGYSYTTTTPVTQYLYIYDPWPTNSGAVYWENWNVFTGQPNPVHAILYVRN